MKKYRVDVSTIYNAHRNAWNAIVNGQSDKLSWADIDNYYYSRFHGKLIREKCNGDTLGGYRFIDFDSKEAYVLFMLEWS
jgi:hypothetical protein